MLYTYIAAIALANSHAANLGSSATSSKPYDYIILGAGAAGCVLANRLSSDPSKRVLLLEAGDDLSRDVRVRIPWAFPKLLRSEADWNYDTEPAKELHGNSVYLCRGKMLGGSTGANVMLYHRGTAADHDAWEASGARGWSSQDVLPYYIKAEDYQEGPSKYHGSGGHLSVQEVPYQNVLSKTFLKALGALGFRPNPDFNDWSTPQEGFGRYKVTQRNGERWSTAKGYLAAAADRPNLDVTSGAQVTRLALDGVGDGLSVSGVEYALAGGKEACVAELAAGGEAILSAGAVQTPQLLMLSGIGPRAHLEEHGISVRKDLPGVGEGLQDHPAVVVSYEATKRVAITDKALIGGIGKLINPLVLARWFLRGKGPLTSCACDHGGFFRSSPDVAQPDIQLRFVPARATSASGMNTLADLAGTRRFKSGYSAQVVACRPKSRGRVRLSSPDPFAKPQIEGLYLSEPSAADLTALREGIKLGRRVCAAGEFDWVRGEEVFPGASVRTDEQIDDYIRSTIHSANALTSSCRMGRDDDDSAVLDSQLRVRGVGGLRVVDASAMPGIIGGQTGAPTVMIAEKAADMIMGDRGMASGETSSRQQLATA